MSFRRIRYDKQAHLHKAPITLFNLTWNNPSHYPFGYSQVPDFPPDAVTRVQHRLAIYVHRRGVIGHGCHRRISGKPCVFTDTVVFLDKDAKGNQLFHNCSNCIYESGGLCGAKPGSGDVISDAASINCHAPSQLPISATIGRILPPPSHSQTSDVITVRSITRQDTGEISGAPMELHETVHGTPSMLTQTSTLSTDQQPDVGWSMNQGDLPIDHPLQFMHQLESIGWNGGDSFFGGKHDEFCFVCGGSMELFGCQTCETCYHASCMSPTLEPDDVPTFWFCPHCVDRELHIPPDPPSTYYTPISPQPSAQAHPSPSSAALARNEITIAAQNASTTGSEQHGADGSNSKRKSEGQMQDIEASMLKVRAVSRSLDPKIPIARNEPKVRSKGNTGRPRRSYSPPRKRSKYSAFSSEVDKALAVIHKELEAAAQNSRSEDSLRERIQTLEQELRLKDGQILLTSRELELARQNGGDSTRLGVENRELKEQNDRLKELVEKKDAELRDWRSKLKTMLGNDMD